MQALTRYGYEPKWHDIIYNTIANLLAVNLRNGKAGFQLSSIPMANTIRDPNEYWV